MNKKPLGGRGKKSPYNTITVRIPEDLELQVEALCDDYRELIYNSQLTTTPNTVKHRSSFSNISYTEAIEQAKVILSKKISAKNAVLKLLQVLYGGEMDENVLK